MIGDKVFIPGSPALTIQELLDEAERSLDLEGKATPRLATPRTPLAAPAFVTPQKPAEESFGLGWTTPDVSGSFVAAGEGLGGAGAWTRKEWKKLDSCLTDERLAVGGYAGLADVGAVDLEKVVDRFFAMLQEPVVSIQWNRCVCVSWVGVSRWTSDWM